MTVGRLRKVVTLVTVVTLRHTGRNPGSVCPAVLAFWDVSGSGLIYAVIVAAWAAYLVPMWLRRGDTVEDVEDGGEAEARAGHPGPGSQDETPGEDRAGGVPGTKLTKPVADEAEETDRAAVPETTAEPPCRRAAAARREPGRPPAAARRRERTRAAPPRRRRSRVITRRRRIVLALFLTVVTGGCVVAYAGLTWSWLPITALVLLIAYLIRLRAVVRRRMRAQKRRPHTTRPAPGGPGAPAVPRARRLDPSDDEWNADLPASRTGDAWDPVRMPLPTYVTKPPAPRRRPSRADPAGDPAAETPPPAQPAPPAQPRREERVYDQYADEPDRRAVNE